MNPAFLHEIQRLVVAQICTCFDTVKSSAADALAEVLASYIKEIGRAAHDAADVAGRAWPPDVLAFKARATNVVGSEGTPVACRRPARAP